MKYDQQMKNRLKRIEGQVRGLIRMMEEEKECKEVVAQISAVRNALDKAAALIVGTNLEQCVREQIEQGLDTEETIQEAVNLLVKSR